MYPAQARSQNFDQEGPSLAREQGTHYQKPKTPGVWPTIFLDPFEFIFIFLFSL